MDASALFAAMQTSEHIAVLGHGNPDGDAMGACCAVALAAAGMGKQPYILLENIPAQYDGLLAGERFVIRGAWDDVPCDLCIALDCGDAARLGRALPVFTRAPKTVNIDHHKSNTRFAALNIVAPDVSSTCELVYTLLRGRITLDADIASALFLGLATDTGGFRHASATPEAFETAAALVRLGADAPLLQCRAMYEHSAAKARMLGVALSHMTQSAAAPIVSARVTLAEMAANGAETYDLDDIVEYLLNTVGAEVSVFVSERADGTCKASLRSHSMDVSAVAVRFGGGGHMNAAGASLPCGLDEACARVLAACEEKWRAYEIQNNRH